MFGCSASGLTFASFERQGEGLVLQEHRVLELPANTFQQGLLGGPPREPRLFEEQVGELIRSLGTTVHEASLVLPDGWLRTAFAEISDLPSDAKGRDEVLRWKLKRLVPFRVDELRVRATEVTPLAAQEEPHRLLLGFGLETLFNHLERAFSAAGVRLGRIANAGLSALGALAPAVRSADGGALTSLTMASPDGYTFVVSRDDEPVLHRFKVFARELPEAARAASVIRDLRLTRTFLGEQFPDERIARALLATSETVAPVWGRWIEEGLEAAVELLGAEHLVPLRSSQDGLPPRHELLPLVGTACQEVTS